MVSVGFIFVFPHSAGADNLSEFGIPDIKGLDPIRIIDLDKTLKIPGKETKYELYRVDKTSVLTYKIDGRQYGVAYDRDNKLPIDVLLMDPNGYGYYEPVPSNKPFEAPEWVILHHQ